MRSAGCWHCRSRRDNQPMTDSCRPCRNYNSHSAVKARDLVTKIHRLISKTHYFQATGVVFLKTNTGRHCFLHMFPQYPAVGEETERSFPLSGHAGPFFGGVFPLKIKYNPIRANLRGSGRKYYPAGIGTSIAVLLRASIKRSSEGWFFVKRSIRPRDRSTTRHGSLIIENRMAFMRLLLQNLSSTCLFIIALNFGF